MKNRGDVFFKDASSGKIAKHPDSSFSFSYEAGDGPSVSLTLPRNQTKYESEELFPFFDGLIPEGWLLDLAWKNWKIPKDDRMTLLLTTCQDCIGAVHVTQEGEKIERRNLKGAVSEETPIDFSSPQCLACLAPLEGEKLYHKKCALNLFGFPHAPMVYVSIQRMEELALLQLNQRLTLTGVQRKLSLSLKGGGKGQRLTVMGIDGRFILKPSSADFPEMAQVEHLSMKLAQLVKLPMASCGLVFLTDGELAYLTRRFDREGSEKVQMEDFCQLSGQPTRKKYSGSGEGLGKVVDQFSNLPQDDKLTLFQILLFSFWIGNSDMHLKNFSLWKDPKSGLIRLTPGYDFLSTRLLISKEKDNEDLALPINGKKNKLKWSDFLALGKSYKIPEKVLKRVREQMLDQFLAADDLIERSFLSEEMKMAMREILIERSHRLM